MPSGRYTPTLPLAALRNTTAAPEAWTCGVLLPSTVFHFVMAKVLVGAVVRTIVPAVLVPAPSRLGPQVASQ